MRNPAAATVKSAKRPANTLALLSTSPVFGKVFLSSLASLLVVVCLSAVFLVLALEAATLFDLEDSDTLEDVLLLDVLLLPDFAGVDGSVGATEVDGLLELEDAAVVASVVAAEDEAGASVVVAGAEVVVFVIGRFGSDGVTAGSDAVVAAVVTDVCSLVTGVAEVTEVVTGGVVGSVGLGVSSAKEGVASKAASRTVVEVKITFLFFI